MPLSAVPLVPPTDQAKQLRGFRTGFYRCWGRWPDAGFELCEALLCAPGPVSSVPALSLEPVFRRSHGSLYKALDRGRIDTEAMRDLLAAHRPRDWPLVFAVDESTWARCDAETSPERGFYYSASKHSAGQPIVAGWSYQWITQLDWGCDSWTAPMDAHRIPPGTDTVAATATQVRGLVARLGEQPGEQLGEQPGEQPGEQLGEQPEPRGTTTPTFVFDAGYDPIALTHELAEVRAVLVVRVRDDRVFYTRPPEPAPGTAKPVGRPRRHGQRRECAKPQTWPAPDYEQVTTDSRYGTVHVTAWNDLHPKLGCRGHWKNFEEPPIVSGTVVRVDVQHLQAHQPDQEDPVALGRWRCRRRSGHRSVLARLPTSLRHRAHLPVRQEHPGLDHPIGTHPRTSRHLDLARHRRLHPTTTRPRTRGRSPAALGTPRQTRQTHPRPRPTRVSAHRSHPGHTSQPAKTQQSRTRTPDRQPHRTTHPLPRHQESRLTTPPRFNRKLRTCWESLGRRERRIRGMLRKARNRSHTGVVSRDFATQRSALGASRSRPWAFPTRSQVSAEAWRP